MVSIANLIAAQSCGAQHVNCAAILTAQKVEIGDVVICLRDEQRHAVLLAMLARMLMGLKRFVKMPETDEANRKIAEHRRDAFAVSVLDHAIVSTAVTCQRICEPVLTMDHIPSIDLETRQPQFVAKLHEDNPLALGG